MRRSLDTLRRRVARDDGFTLVELLMSTFVGLMVVGIAATVMVTAVRSQPGLNARDNSISQARTTTERLVRELRQGGTVFTATSNQLAFITYVHSATCGGAYSSSSIQCRVTYTCSTSGTCTRVEANPDGSSPGAARTVAAGLSSGNVFSYQPDPSIPNFITVTFVYPGQNGHDAITVSDGAALMDRTDS